MKIKNQIEKVENHKIIGKQGSLNESCGSYQIFWLTTQTVTSIRSEIKKITFL